MPYAMLGIMATPMDPPPHKRPRGLWKAQTSRPPLLFSQAVPGPTKVFGFHDSDTDDNDDCYEDDYEDDDDGTRSWSSGSSKRRRLSGLEDAVSVEPCKGLDSRPSPASTGVNNGPSSPRQSPAMDRTLSTKATQVEPKLGGDYEDWEHLKDTFAKAAEQYESDDSALALPLLRQVFHECHRFLRDYNDPSVLFTNLPPRSDPSPQILTPSEDSLSWGGDDDDDDKRRASRETRNRGGELPTALHAILGICLFLFGNLVAQDPSVVIEGEPASATDYWLAALDVFETGENLPSRTTGRSEAEDWRMAIVWGRTLVCLADEKISRKSRAKKADVDSGSGFSSTFSDAFMSEEPKWPVNSIFHTIAERRPPVTRRMSLAYASANDLMMLAMDQFSRGIFHMPHAQTSHSYHFHCSSSSQSPESLSFSRPQELFTIASEVLGVAERLEMASERQYWAAWADSVFNQMKMEVDMDAWRGPITQARGQCWLIMGSAQVDELEAALDRGETHVLRSEEAEEAREGLGMAISFFERAKGSISSALSDAQDLQSLLAEALLTLANLTIDENKREELYSRAQAEGGDKVNLELDTAKEYDDVRMDEG